MISLPGAAMKSSPKVGTGTSGSLVELRVLFLYLGVAALGFDLGLGGICRSVDSGQHVVG